MQVVLDVGSAQFADGVPWWMRGYYRRLLCPPTNPFRRWLSAMAGFSLEASNKALKHLWGMTELPFIADGAFLALATAEVKSGTTNAVLEAKEATYTGYARVQVKGTELSSFIVGETAQIKNNVELKFPAVTAGGDTITFWALCNKKKGEATTLVIMYGSCTSTVLSTTQTPPVVAVEKLVGELK